MAKCQSCGRRGLFLKLTEGLCSNCFSQTLRHGLSIATDVVESVITNNTADDADDYLQLRQSEEAWLESHYDFNTLDGINAIPVTANPMRPPSNSTTGEVYYYLRRKGYEYEDAGNIEMALACLKKSNELIRCRDYYSLDECYPYVKMLARAGCIDEAYKEKEDIDKNQPNLYKLAEERVFQNLDYMINPDLIIMSAHGSSCTECAKYQGRVYSISGKSTLFPKAPDFFYTHEGVHPGCGHSFFPYEHGVNDPRLEYTLSVHPLLNPAYGSDIVSFSNRPFVDDRTEECKREAEDYQKKRAEEQAQKQYYYDNMIIAEARRGQEVRDYKWLQENIPDKCPKSLSGFRRMKTQKTKNYQILQQLATDLGRKL